MERFLVKEKESDFVLKLVISKQEKIRIQKVVEGLW